MKNLKNHWFVGVALLALAAPIAILNAQNGGGRGRGNAAPAQFVPPPTSPVTGNAVTGKGLYYAYGCYACHGYNGETGARAFVGRWGNLCHRTEFHYVPTRPRERRARHSLDVHAEFRREFHVR